MAIWETTLSTHSWSRADGSLAKSSVTISKIDDEKSGETTFEVNETVKITASGLGNTLEAKFVGTVTVDGVVYPVIDFRDTRYIVGFDADGVSTIPYANLNAGAFTVCFFSGTLIATPSGERKVEQLVSGDLVLIGNSGAIPSTWLGRMFARAVSVKWIGRQTVSTLFGPADRLMPVRFAAGSLGGGGGKPFCRIAI